MTSAERAVRLDGWPEEVVGNSLAVPVIGDQWLPGAYLDNAASTPPLRAVADAVSEFLPYYASVHRGAGYTSRIATAAYDGARERVARFVGATDDQVVIFVKNTTEGLNRIARLHAERGTTVFVSTAEHHANLLPWRWRAAQVRFFQADANGAIDADDLRRQLRDPPPGPRLVALSGAYNVSGYVPPIHRFARLAHEYGAEIIVDGAQLAPHRRVALGGTSPEETIDYFVFSAHKMYAPFGSGALIAPRRSLEGAGPDLLGGGIVDLVTLDEVVWNDLPDREEAGSPNVIGAIALAAALDRLEALGRQRIEDQEHALTGYALARLAAVPGLRVLGPPAGRDRVGVLSFVLPGLSHDRIAAALAYEHAISVRSGCFCAHPAMFDLLALDEQAVTDARVRLRRHDRADIPGAVRASLGLQSTQAEVDRLVAALTEIADRGPRVSYERGPDGELRPVGWEDELPAHLRRRPRSTNAG